MWIELLMVAAGGAIGSMLRYILTFKVQSLTQSYFPYGILIVNILGCLLMGFLATLFIDRFVENSLWRIGILVGLLGGFTTFSSFSFDVITLFNSGRVLLAGANIILGVVLCLIATGAGVAAARMF